MATVITITGQVLLPDGNGPSGGTISYELTGNAADASDNKIIGRGVIHVPDGGDFDAMTVPPTIVATANLTPATLQYKAKYKLTDEDGTVHAIDETWEVPATPSSQAIGTFAT